MKLRLLTGEEYEINAGESILETLRRNDQYLIASCGGKGSCGKCVVRILHGNAAFEARGKLSEEKLDKGYVLACQAVPETDLTIDIPQVSRIVVGDKIAISKSRELFETLNEMKGHLTPLVMKKRFVLPPPTLDDHISDLARLKRALEQEGLHLLFPRDFVMDLADKLREYNWDIGLCYAPREETALAIEAGEGNGPRIGIAVDIGTTTVVVNLIDLADGRIIDVGSTYNSQIRFGDDVITRIVHATEGGKLKELKHAVTSDINNLTTIMCERHSIDPSRIGTCSIAGNTVMSHLFWELDPSHIREAPYIPTANRFPVWNARDAHIRIRPNAPIYTLPCVASYVGGDIVAGVLASEMHRKEEIALFMDIGTNGEIVVGNNEWLMTAACSAGPCFEGSGIRCGMRATKGAIESITFNESTLEPATSVIGNTKPLGICGSGMIDAIAGMYFTGIIDQRGKLVKEKAPDRIRDGHEGPEYLFYSDENHEILLSEVDIENIIRAKAAIYAGVSLLLKEVGMTPEILDKVYIAGGFGNYLDIKKGIILGMLPDLPVEKYVYLGNTSIAGSYLSLMSEDMRNEAEDIAAKMTYIELSVSNKFMDEYMSAMFLPHTDISLFPSVQTLLGNK